VRTLIQTGMNYGLLIFSYGPARLVVETEPYLTTTHWDQLKEFPEFERGFAVVRTDSNELWVFARDRLLVRMECDNVLRLQNVPEDEEMDTAVWETLCQADKEAQEGER